MRFSPIQLVCRLADRVFQIGFDIFVAWQKVLGFDVIEDCLRKASHPEVGVSQVVVQMPVFYATGDRPFINFRRFTELVLVVQLVRRAYLGRDLTPNRSG